MITFHVVTIFPEMFGSYLNESILRRAIKGKKISVKFYNPRDFTKDKHKKVDDKPYGGGPGMVMNAEPILLAVKKAKGRKKNVKVLITSAGGKEFTNTFAQKLTKHKDIIIIAGRYEGIDARVKKILKADLSSEALLCSSEVFDKREAKLEEVSIGNYVVTGGELPAMVMIDAISRQLKGVLGKFESVEENRIASHEMYTRPETLSWQGKNYKVPKVLTSGDHKKIDEWRKKK